MTTEEIAKKHGRTEGAVRQKAYQEGISFGKLVELRSIYDLEATKKAHGLT